MSEISKTSLKRSKPSYFMSILGVALVLFILGLLGWIVINASKLENYFKGNVQVHAFIREGSPQKEIDSLLNYVQQRPYATKVEYVTKEMAKQKFIGDNNEDWNKVLDYNPLPASVDYYLKPQYVNKDSLPGIVADAQKFFIVSEVKYPDAVVNSLNAMVRRVEVVLLVIAALLSLIAIVLIDNTIKLAMFSHRFIIKTMQMVGATRGFITKPINQRAVINGLIAAGIAIVTVYGTILMIEGFYADFKLLRDNAGIMQLFFVIILLGITISLGSTHRAVIKYLRMKLDDLY